jgi:protease-4
MGEIDTDNSISATGEPSAQSSPSVIHLRSAGSGRTVLWVLISVVVGFLLPVCSCALLLFAGLVSLGALSAGTVAETGIGDAVAIVRVEGTISSGNASDFGTGAISGVVIQDLETAEADPSVKAIVLRVDSPGGSVTGSAQIHEVVEQLKKPVVVSMSSVAASGGYYISAPADYIIAREDTLTGSLGVIMTVFSAEELIDKIGVDAITIVSGPNKSIGGLWQDLTPEHRQILESLIDESYDEFVRVVVDGRGLSQTRVLELADGRVFSGRQALANGLADALGNQQDAIDKAADMGGISGQPRIVEYNKVPGLEQLLFGVYSRLNRTEADQVRELITEFTAPLLEYRYVGPISP